MSDTSKTHKTVILGSTGRLGQVIHPFWNNQNTVWHSREPKQGYQSLDLLNDKRGFIDLLQGAQTVLCLAGVTPTSSTVSYQQNAAIATACLDAAYTAKVKRVFLTSSAAVYGASNGILNETDQPQPLSDYGKSKLEMEERARSHLQTSTILRIGNVAGADAILGNWHPQMALDTFPNGSTPKRSYIGPKTLAEVIEKLVAIEHLPPVLNLAAPRGIHMNELLDHANLTYVRKPASDNAIESVILNTSLLEEHVAFNHADSLAKQMVTQWKRT
jgi:nucleoside-diphosphate-sugar epimerase